MKTLFNFELLLILMLSSCGPQKPVSQSDLLIIGGTPAKSGEFPETVALMRDDKSICTGVAIGPRTVMTAAHCVESANAANLKIFWGEDVNSADSGNTSSISKILLHPNLWNDYLSGNDLAVLTTADDLPGKTASIVMDASHRLESLTLVGFGVTSNQPNESTRGIKNWTTTKTRYISGNDLYAGNQISDTCQGDSGGPAFLSSKEGTRHLLAITSRGPTPCAQDRDPGIFTMIRASSCWLLDVLKAQDPSWQIACNRYQNGRALTLSAPDLNQLRQLNAANQNIRTIDILSRSSALQVIDLSSNQISDPTPLLRVKSLKHIDLRNNRIDDLTIFAKLNARGIRALGLRTQAKNIADTEFLRIAKLGFDAGPDNRSTVLALRDLLTAGTNERKSRDLAMRRHLGLASRGVRSLASLASLENLTSLLLSDNPMITDLSPLKTLPALRYLDIRRTGVPLQDPTQNSILCELRANGVEVVTDEVP